MSDPIQVDGILKPRRGSKGQWESINPILQYGEIALEHPNQGISYGQCRVKVGDGVTPWNNLPYAIDFSRATGVDGGTPTTESAAIKFKSGSTAQWLQSDPILEIGEPAFDVTLNRLKIGDGVHRFSELKYVGQQWETSLIYDFGDYDHPTS